MKWGRLADLVVLGSALDWNALIIYRNMSGSIIGRSYLAIAATEDGTVLEQVHFPYDSSPVGIVCDFESRSYKVLDCKVENTADDEKLIAKVWLQVQRKPTSK